jgi:hypothetical protein
MLLLLQLLLYAGCGTSEIYQRPVAISTPLTDKAYRLLVDCYVFKYESEKTLYIGSARHGAYRFPKTIIPANVGTKNAEYEIIAFLPRGTQLRVKDLKRRVSPVAKTVYFEVVVEGLNALDKRLISAEFITDNSDSRMPQLFSDVTEECR